MQSILDHATRLTDQMQAVIGFLEIAEHQKAMHAAKASIATLHLMSTMIAVQAAHFDSVAAETHRLTGELAHKHRAPK